MTILLELDAHVEARAREKAQQQGLPLTAYLVGLIAAQVAPPSPTMSPVDNTLALFAQWDVEDATEDPEELARRQHEWEQIEARLQAHPFSLREYQR